MSKVHTFQSALVTLFREALDGRPQGQDYTWFVQGKEGIFWVLDQVNSDQASQKPHPAAPSIAAHAYHLRFILAYANTYRGEPDPEGTWDSSWEKQTVTPDEWVSLRKEIRDAYKAFVDWFESNADWEGDDKLIGVLANVPHVAYHLGAMRQVLYQVAES